MKTKSKRFLKLAPLCLALLSTTLLTTQPVKAEGVLRDPQPVTQDSGQRGSRQSQQEGVGSGYSDNDEELQKHQEEAYQAGWDAGLLAGKGAEQPNVERENIPSSKYDYADYDGEKFDVEYKDGYQAGHKEGWGEEHPFQAALNWLWDIVSGLFGL
ncbi:Uncharacterised protein [Streptococcus pyogenes]|uniref:hypothetical protein n=1 Tax=Streptococcus pyogenes TaxID=1314 RepID=UPI00109CF842|nr:hypothetical protein [Streptococcus pyogenes]VGV69589.1 Uncharacterised protein [Streptococcus pyogenes]